MPSLERARRERSPELTGLPLLRSVAGARFVRYLADAAAVAATSWYYAENNSPTWPAWAIFAAFFLGIHLPRLLSAGADFAGLKRSRA